GAGRYTSDRFHSGPSPDAPSPPLAFPLSFDSTHELIGGVMVLSHLLPRILYHSQSKST
ncbi:hypothetical protein A2U01_0084915, partial [Trifolium medium]|nr:hypothetical protein [Trifolium medium]